MLKKIDISNLQSEGYNSLFGRGLQSGREYVVFNSNQISNIRYVSGIRPNAVFRCSDEKIVTDHQIACEIVNTQQMVKTRIGHFGKAYYMFATIDDAMNLIPNETILMAKVKMENFLDMQNQQKSIYRQPKWNKTFLAKVNNTPVFIIKYKSLITRIHY